MHQKQHMPTSPPLVLVPQPQGSAVELKTRANKQPGLDVNSHCRKEAQRQKHHLPLRLLISSISRRRKEALPGQEGVVALRCW